MTKTMAVTPPNESEINTEEFVEVLKKVQDVIDRHEDTFDDVSVEDLLSRANVTEHEYIQAVTWAHTRNGQPAILLKRTPAEMFINNYNTTILLGWGANLDIQYVSNVFACVSARKDSWGST